MSAVLRLGTRRSALARTQSEAVAAALAERTGVRVELVEVTTRGDVSRAPLTAIGGTGVFVSALREALLEHRVDLAVHSLKDLPTAPADGLLLAAVPAREDPRDVLVARDGLALAQLPAGARVGTGSPRRAAQLLAARPDLVVVDVRGNIDTRLGLVADGVVDAVVLARAGLRRIGRAGEASDVLDPDVVMPAPGQGALAVECRADDAATAAACAALDDAGARAAVTAERALLAALEAGCTAPVGALAEVATDGSDGSVGSDGGDGSDGSDGVLRLRGLVGAPDGSRLLRAAATGPADGAAVLGRRVAAALLADGAAALTDPPAAPPGPPAPADVPSRSSRSARPAQLHASNAHDAAAPVPPERVHP